MKYSKMLLHIVLKKKIGIQNCICLTFFFFQGELKEGIGQTCEKGHEMMGAFICIPIGFQIFQIWYNAYL